ncbi:chondroitin AC/alginate lyase [Cristinia sonorae]|uniref:Chondroitin AC/alginate lyase n=1 Tax=Cristinia sonorae TaxID=1940300 RepID=A0A8K0XPS1_9AGAR|nr:chondroitin AC/alginate lyase [Cristinia sonorae]
MFSRTLAAALLLGAATCGLASEPNDWVNVDYVLKQAGSGASSETSASRQAISQKADKSAKDGPFTITDTKIKPPNGDIHDYLSWAPYHWPNCNWCSKPANHFYNPNATQPSSSPTDQNPSSGDNDDEYYQESISGDAVDIVDDILLVNILTEPVNGTDGYSRRMVTKRRVSPQYTTPSVSSDIEERDGNLGPAIPSLPTPVVSASPPSLPDMPGSPPSLPTPPSKPASSTTRHAVAGTQAPADAHARKGKDSAACTPSPTKSLAPSATWTTCPYEVKDGKVNPDVKLLQGPSILQNMPESVLFNTITYALTKTAVHSQNAAKFIDTFFLAPATLMHPNVNFGQLVRGPGKEMGTFTGVLDFRALVKVVNAVKILKAMKSPDWTSTREQGLLSWMKAYLGWLQSSPIAQQTASKANNHVTFFINQLAATQIHIGDTKGATATLNNYFKKQFADQIAASGEQPFEAIRTRPFHYRAFALEAMITNAKLGDQLGLDFWTTKTKYGATIQTALDYAIAQKADGGDDGVDDIIPHVAAVAAAYGDPKGKYKAYLQKYDSKYKSEPWYFFDQTAALPNSPAARPNKRSENDTNDSHAGPEDGDTSTSTPFSHVPFSCPAVFENSVEVELEDGLFVTCSQLKPLYEIAVDPAIVGSEYRL